MKLPTSSEVLVSTALAIVLMVIANIF